MKHIGIIAEYNPFHNGHCYQLQKVKQSFSDKKILVVMSGEFVQRGEPAIFNKYLRTKCALASGADIVIELPSFFASASAEHFASASVLALAATGVVDTLCFGAECDDIAAFWKIVDFLLKEPAEYQTLLRKHLKEGLSFPKARSLAITSCIQDDACKTILRQPNNILGIEYMKAIRKYHLPITPLIIKRQGMGYHDLTTEHPFSSASALRNKIENVSIASTVVPDFDMTQILSAELQDYIPQSAYATLNKSVSAKALFLSDFYPFLQYALWQQKTGCEEYFEVSKELSNRLASFSLYPRTVEELLNTLSGKHYTNTRIKRALLNILLKRTKQDMKTVKNIHYISYLRLLGFRAESSFVLKEMKQTCQVPLINKVADAKNILSDCAYTLFEKDIYTSMLYRQVFFNKYGITLPSEYEQSVIIHNL